jgi:subtilisin-like proprotein convertase family protein
MQKHFPILAILGGMTALIGTASIRAQTITNSATYSVNASILDNDLSGVSDTRTFTSSIQVISDVNVTLNISGGFIGDFYAYLTHDSGFAVLLNRPGRTAIESFGYPDSGFNVTFDDEASNGDIHSYRLTLNPDGNALTGTWQPDARNIHPGQSLDTTSRGSFLDSFDGFDANGSWTLFVADTSPVGEAVFASWRLEVAGVVPEPGTNLLLVVGGVALLLARRRARAAADSR